MSVKWDELKPGTVVQWESSPNKYIVLEVKPSPDGSSYRLIYFGEENSTWKGWATYTDIAPDVNVIDSQKTQKEKVLDKIKYLDNKYASRKRLGNNNQQQGKSVRSEEQSRVSSLEMGSRWFTQDFLSSI